jgi:hypothetical protein
MVAAPIKDASVLEGAAVDAPIAGFPGAVWSDPNNTGYVTGYPSEQIRWVKDELPFA